MLKNVIIVLFEIGVFIFPKVFKTVEVNWQINLPNKEFFNWDKDERDDKETKGEVEKKRRNFDFRAIFLRIQSQVFVMMNLGKQKLSILQLM